MSTSEKRAWYTTHFVTLIAAFLGGAAPGILAYVASLEEEYRQAKTKSITSVLSGSDEIGLHKLPGELDGLYVFTHDPHIYSFSWRNLKLIHRNIRIPIRAYGGDESRRLGDIFYNLVVLATAAFEDRAKFPFIDGATTFGSCFERPGEGKKIEHVTNFSDASKFCFPNDSNRLQMVREFASLLDHSIKCYATALNESLIFDLGNDEAQATDCELPHFYLSTDPGGNLVIRPGSEKGKLVFKNTNVTGN